MNKRDLTCWLLVLFTVCTSLHGSDTTSQLYELQWFKSVAAPTRGITSFNAIEYNNDVLVLGHYYGRIGVLATIYDPSGAVKKDLSILAPDTQAYVVNACVPRVLGSNKLRLYGTECRFHSVPPLHLSKVMYDFRPLYIDCDSNLLPSAPQYFGSTVDRWKGSTHYNALELGDDVATIASDNDTVKVLVYDESLRNVTQSTVIVLDSGRVFSTSAVYKIADDSYCFAAFTIIDSGDAHYEVYKIKEHGRVVEKFPIFNRISLDMIMVGTDTIVSASNFKNDSTNELNLYLYSVQGTPLGMRKVLPSLTLEPAKICLAKNGHIIIVGSCRAPFDESHLDANRRAFICLLDHDYRVVWYYVKDKDSVAQQFTEAIQTKDGSIWAIGWSGSQSNPATLVSKFVSHTLSSVANDMTDPTHLVLSPQPASDHIQLGSSYFRNEVVDVCMHSIEGVTLAEMTSAEMTSNGIRLTLTDIPNGTYFVTVKSSKHIVRRLVSVIH